MDTSLKKLSNDFFSYQPLVQFILDSYNDFLLTGIDDIFAMNPIQYSVEDGEVMVEFKKAYLCPPSVGDQKCRGGPLWPNVCRTDKLDYVGSLMVDIGFYINGQLKKEQKNVFLCYLPVMLGSSLCNLVVNKLEREGEGEKTFAAVKECGKDPLGYFIMNGTEKVLVTQEKLATNLYFVLKEKKETKKKEKGGQETVEKYICEMRSEGPDGMISLIKIMIHEEVKKKSKYLAIGLPFIKNGNSINIVNLIRLILLLEGDTDALKNASDTFMTYVRRLTTEIKMMNLVEQTIENANELFDEDAFMSKMVKDFGYAVETTNLEEEVVEDDNQTFVATDNDKENMKLNLEKYFFPHMARDYMDGKMMILAMMTVRLMKTYFDYKPESNRDHYGVKRLETPGILLQTLFGKLFQNFVKEVANQAPKTGDGKFTTVLSTINNKKDKISKELRGSFVKESWGVKGGKQKTGVSQALTGRLSIPFLYSALRDIGTGTNKSSKASKPRLLDTTQFGVICPAQVSDGDQCLTKHADVLSSDGISSIKISDLTKDSKVTSVDPIKFSEESTGIHSQFNIEPKDKNKKLYRIETISGRVIEATCDHPFLTEDGWVKVEDLKVGDKVAIRHMLIPIEEVISEETILDKKTFIERVKPIYGEIKMKRIEGYANELEEKGLLPLKTSDERLPIIARLAGAIWTDGSINNRKKNNSFDTNFNVGCMEDIRELTDDIERLGFEPTTITEKNEEMIEKETGRKIHHHTFRTGFGASLTSLFLALGLPFGKKTTKETPSVPQWIMKGSKIVKREWLAGFQGGDGSAVHYIHQDTNTRNKQAYVARFGPTNQDKVEEHVGSLVKFMEQNAVLFKEFGVTTHGVNISQKRYTDKKTVGLVFSRSEQNMVKYLDTIGYRYCREKEMKGREMVEFLKYKQVLCDKVRERRIRATELFETRHIHKMTYQQMADSLGVTFGSFRRLLRDPSDDVVMPKETIPLKQFLELVHPENGVLHVPIAKIEEIPSETVYDFTTVSEHHSFVANSFITHNCGLKKQFAVSAYVTTQQSHDAILGVLRMDTDTPLVTGEKEVGKEDIILLNGAYLGYGNAEGLHKMLITARRQKKIPFHTGLVLAKEVDQLGVSFELRIFTTKGRAVRPLYIVEKGELLLDKKDLRKKDVTFEDLVQAGVVEYVDVSESEYLLIAITPDKLLNGKSYTHCEIDPSFQLGVASNVMAFAQHNPLPRVGYTAGMLKQNVSVPITSYQYRPDTGIKILRYPQKALIHSAMYDIIGLSDQPGSQIARVGIMSAGYNQDDAVIINKAALERGMFNSDAYDIYTVETQHKEEFVTSKYPDFVHGVVPERRIKYTVFERVREKKYTEEEIRQIITPGGQLVQVTQKGKMWVYTFKKPSQVEGKYETREIERKLDEPDLFPEDFQAQGGEFLKQEKREDKIVYTVRFPVYITEETPVGQGDVLAVKTVTTKEGVKKESSTFMTGKRGVVDRIFRKNRGNANQIVRIRIRTSHLGDIGDKFCAPYAQKGVLGMIVPQEDMPFSHEGLTPDILVNPHAFPSRMTIGMLLELLVGKVMTCSTERVSRPLVMTREIWEKPILNIKGKKWKDLTKQEQDIVVLLNQSDKDLMDKIMKGQDFKLSDKITGKRFSGNPGDSLLTLPKEEQKTFNRLHRQIEKKREEERREKFCDATAFRSIDMKAVEKELFEMGYQREGEEVLYSGKTGIRINAKIFVGMCNYMALKHMSEEKMHARDLGRKQPVNRQATRGKSKGGGIRFGEMEKDAVFAHGATGIIQSRLRDDSDVYHTFACKKCGNFCYFNSEAEEYVCRMCEDKIEPVKVTIPYSFQMLNNYEMAMGIKTTMEFGESNDLPDVVRREVRMQGRDVRGNDTLNVQPYVGRQSGEFISYAEPLEDEIL